MVISQPHWRKVRPAAQAAIEAALAAGYEQAGTLQASEGLVELWRRR
ncbi:MAG TPA: hypothetical protein VEX11_08140 [Acetobacteraceae bacterium]|nr:hypothetical protein [Acetobacteraceae bacterium]